MFTNMFQVSSAQFRFLMSDVNRGSVFQTQWTAKLKACSSNEVQWAASWL